MTFHCLLDFIKDISVSFRSRSHSRHSLNHHLHRPRMISLLPGTEPDSHDNDRHSRRVLLQQESVPCSHHRPRVRKSLHTSRIPHILNNRLPDTIFLPFSFSFLFLLADQTRHTCSALNIEPTMMMPAVQMAMNSASSFGFTALRSMMSDGSESVVTAIMNESTVPSFAPL